MTIQAQVLELMNELKEKSGTSMLLITHDLGVVAEVCDTVAVMYAGEIVEHGTLEDVFDHTPASLYRGPVRLHAQHQGPDRQGSSPSRA